MNKMFKRNLLATGGFVIVDIDSFELKIRIAAIASSRIDSVFIWDDFPELKKMQIYKLNRRSCKLEKEEDDH